MVILPPSEIRISRELKRLFGCVSNEPVRLVDPPFPVRIDTLHYHDVYHLETSLLPRIEIGKHWVSGIHGINSPAFHDTPIVEEYSADYDEARVAIHEWLTRPSCYTLIKFMIWCGWLTIHRINPIAVIHRHYGSIKAIFGKKGIDPSYVQLLESEDSSSL